jgi:hypothetical protein
MLPPPLPQIQAHAPRKRYSQSRNRHLDAIKTQLKISSEMDIRARVLLSATALSERVSGTVSSRPISPEDMNSDGVCSHLSRPRESDALDNLAQSSASDLCYTGSQFIHIEFAEQSSDCR